MSWRNIHLIYAREIRDQLRDRRTLFMIAVLPLLLYPLLGMSVLQLSQFVRKSEPRVLVIGSENLNGGGDAPKLFVGDKFAPTLVDDPQVTDWLRLEFAKADGSEDAEPRAAGGTVRAAEGESALQRAEQRLKSGEVQVVLSFPPDFGERLRALQTQIKDRAAGEKPAESGTVEIPRPQLLYNSGKEKSRVAHMQVEQILDVWKSQIVRANLLASQVPAVVAKPFELKRDDVAEQRQQQALMWSRILPFVLFIWALTGAFYPAVDLCAGEKERGTLETLLSSPAARTEIVWGKMLTVMTFSCATAILNLSSLGMTSKYAMAQLSKLPGADFGDAFHLPPLGSLLWLLAALLPMSALFSALCLACAAFARSTKEGQYYLMPLFLISMPLMMLPLAPGSELSLGNSLIPITGVVFLVMSLVQGEYGEALRYCVPVILVTLVCCHWAIRWAVYQFNQESVIFRESERFDPKRWLVHLVRDRQETPTLAEAFFCVVLIFVTQFFVQMAITANMPADPQFGFLVLLVFTSQVVCIALPALLMALILTGRPAKTLLLDRLPKASTCLVAVLLAVLLHPLGRQIVEWVQNVYPLPEDMKHRIEFFHQLVQTAPYPWIPYAMLAVLPAICEELAFRGFILSGLRHLGSKWWAIGLSAVFFGVAHGVLQQSLAAVALGIVLGYVAVQTGSLIPCALFHLTYNLVMLGSPLLLNFAGTRTGLKWLFQDAGPDKLLYQWPVVAVCSAGAAVLLVWLHRLPYQATREEQISDARARQPHHPVPAGAQGSAE